MKILFETPAGYTLFEALDAVKTATKSSKSKSKSESKSKSKSNLIEDELELEKLITEKPHDCLKLVAFHKFADTTEAVAAATALIEGKLEKNLKKFIKKQMVKSSKKESSDEKAKLEGGKLVVSDVRLATQIKEAFEDDGIKCESNTSIFRGIRENLHKLVPELGPDEVKSMMLGLAHSLSRYKLKFSPDKVDTMIVQAINLLDELDKEINTYSMRVKEWYGWHYPEMQKIVTDNREYAECVRKAGMRVNMKDMDFSDIIADSDVEERMKETAEVSMGTDISEADMLNIRSLCDQVISLADYRKQLDDYLKERMNAIAPNLSVMVGELVGARFIAHAGSLINLAKAPASTVQIFGAEKALFRALKTKSNTPKHGLIFSSSLVGQSSAKNKGKISRILAAKAALAIRVDALGDEDEATIGYECREKVEARMRQLETGEPYKLNSSSNSAAAKAKQPKKYEGPSSSSSSSSSSSKYNTASDVVMSTPDSSSETKKEKKKKSKKDKKEKEKGKKGKQEDEDEAEEDGDEEEEEAAAATAASGKKKRKRREEAEKNGKSSEDSSSDEENQENQENDEDEGDKHKHKNKKTSGNDADSKSISSAKKDKKKKDKKNKKAKLELGATSGMSPLVQDITGSTNGGGSSSSKKEKKKSDKKKKKSSSS